VVTRGGIQREAMSLFEHRDFDSVTMGEIAESAGISRRTLFRYFPSKNELVWGEFEDGLASMRALFASIPRDKPLGEALREVIVAFNEVPISEMAIHRHRMNLILSVPALQAYSTLKFSQWREVVARFVAAHLGIPMADWYAQFIGHVSLAASLAAYDCWLTEGGDLSDLLDRSFRTLERGLNE
jgi:mycofactocin system transcriptional regulator